MKPEPETGNASAQTFCVHQPACPGCPLSHLPYAEQLAHKQQLLLQALLPYPELQHCASQVRPTRAAQPPTHYRTRAKLVVQGQAVGLFGPLAHEVLDLPQCQILRPRVAHVVELIRRSLPLPVPVLALDVREADAGVLLCLIVPPATPLSALQQVAQRLLAAEPLLCSVSYSERAVNSSQVLGSSPQLLAGVAAAEHHLTPGAPYHLAVSGAFVQAHAGQASALHSVIIEQLQARFPSLQGLKVLELYAGAGALALNLAALGAQVFASDSYAPNIARLEHTAQQQGLSLRAQAEEAHVSLERRQAWDVVLVDPPRRGLEPQVRSLLGEQDARLLLMVSCEPSTLARDLAHLSRVGWSSVQLLPWDMIPQSEAVEALVVLQRAAPSAPSVLYQDAALIAVDKPPFLPTTPQSEYRDSLLQRVRLVPGCEAAVPVHRLDIGTSGVCLFARRPEQAHALSQALAAGRKRYTALAEGVVNKRGRIARPVREGRALRAALTLYTREQLVGTHSLVHAFPQHGRKHQLRQHFAGIGHALLGDERYGKPKTQRHFSERHGLDRTFLHCARIELELPSGAVIIDSPLPADLSAVLNSVQLGSKPRGA